MGYNNMVTRTVTLYNSPGGIMPELHLKKIPKNGNYSLYLRIIIESFGDNTSNETYKRCILRAVLPNGDDLFITGFSGTSNHKTVINIYDYSFSKICSKAGKYKCTLTILDSGVSVTRKNYMDQDFHTVLPFWIIVHERAYLGSDS